MGTFFIRKESGHLAQFKKRYHPSPFNFIAMQDPHRLHIFGCVLKPETVQQ